MDVDLILFQSDFEMVLSPRIENGFGNAWLVACERKQT